VIEDVKKNPELRKGTPEDGWLLNLEENQSIK
jgi:hypothetical protein